MAKLICIYGVLLAFSTLQAYNPIMAAKWSLVSGKILLMALIAFILIKHLWQIKVIWLMVLFIVGYISWEINTLYFFHGRLDIFHHGYGNLDNNGAGLLLGMGVGFAYGYATSARYFWQRGLSWFLGALMIHAMLMSYSRGAMLATGTGVIWLLIHHRPRIQAALIASILCIVVSVMAGQEIRDRFWSMTQYETDHSAQSRISSWAAGWSLSWERPLFGQGVRNSSQVIRSYSGNKRNRTIHNQFIQTAADSGIPSACAYTAIVALAIISLHRCQRMFKTFRNDFRNSRIPPPDDTQMQMIKEMEQLTRGNLASLITFIVGAMFLSVESVELPWLLMTIAGLMPAVLSRYLNSLVHPQEVALENLVQEEQGSYVTPLFPRGTMPTPIT